MSDPEWLSPLAHLIQLERQQKPGDFWGSLVTTVEAPAAGRNLDPLLRTRFQEIVGGSGLRMAPLEDLIEILSADLDERRNLIIGAMFDPDQNGLVVVRGDLSHWFAPLSLFPVSGDGTRPDPTRLEVTDCGNAIALGEYEASTDVILYEIDPRYRRELNRKRRAEERGFGPALRRLRLQRRLKQDDFAPLDRKTISRLESQKNRPQAGTLRVLGERLGVEPGEIETF